MIKNVYSIKDVLTEFNNPFIGINDNVVLRDVKHTVNTTPEIKSKISDLELWKLGTFDSETGVYESHPELICKCVSLMEVISDEVQK